MNQSIHGILAALVTPLTADEAIDFGTLAAMADHLICQGLHGLIPLGSTGEYYALSPAERADVLRATSRRRPAACRSWPAPTPGPRQEAGC